MAKNNLLKKLAQDAKNRLKHMDYQNKQENANIIRNIAFENHVRLIKENQNKKTDITILVIDESSNEKKFETKVFDLLERDEDCLNPLKELADNKLFKEMTESEKQKYIFELSERYNKAREKYYKIKQAII